MNDYIKLKKRNIFKLGIIDEDNNVKVDQNGKELYLTFDLEDINTADNYSKCVHLVNKATNILQNRITILKKRQDSNGKGIMTKNQEEEMKLLKEYYKSMEEAMDLFLGKGGTQKIFGNTRYLTMFDDLNEMLEPIMPKLKINFESIEKQIKDKYKIIDSNVLKDE